MPNRVGLNQYIYYINFALYIIKIWLEIAEIAIKPRKTKQNQGEPNQTKPDTKQTKQNKIKSFKLVSLNQLTKKANFAFYSIKIRIEMAEIAVVLGATLALSSSLAGCKLGLRLTKNW